VICDVTGAKSEVIASPGRPGRVSGGAGWGQGQERSGRRPGGECVEVVEWKRRVACVREEVSVRS